MNIHLLPYFMVQICPNLIILPIILNSYHRGYEAYKDLPLKFVQGR